MYRTCWTFAGGTPTFCWLLLLLLLLLLICKRHAGISHALLEQTQEAEHSSRFMHIHKEQ